MVSASFHHLINVSLILFLLKGWSSVFRSGCSIERFRAQKAAVSHGSTGDTGGQDKTTRIFSGRMAPLPVFILVKKKLYSSKLLN
jgi:hypothetical protein